MQMASTVSRKRARSRTAQSRRRVADLTTDELREMLDEVIEEKLAKLGGIQARSPGTRVDAEMRRRAGAVAGKFHSGRSDISEEHDRYLAAGYME